MKVAILANNKNSYPRPMAQGLARMLARLGVESHIFKNAWLIMNQASKSRSGLAIAKRSVKSILWRRLLRQLREFDLVVVVSHVPAAYMRYFFHDEEMRQALPKTPIVLYDLVYLPTRGDWLSRALREGDPEVGIATSGVFGIERDWHLCGAGGQPHPHARRATALLPDRDRLGRRFSLPRSAATGAFVAA